MLPTARISRIETASSFIQPSKYKHLLPTYFLMYLIDPFTTRHLLKYSFSKFKIQDNLDQKKRINIRHSSAYTFNYIRNLLYHQNVYIYYLHPESFTTLIPTANPTKRLLIFPKFIYISDNNLTLSLTFLTLIFQSSFQACNWKSASVGTGTDGIQTWKGRLSQTQ